MSQTLAGRNIVLTGASGALGGAVLQELVAQGAICHLPLIEDAVPPDLDALAGVRAYPNVNLTDEAAVQAFYDPLPPLWAAINVAGGFAFAPIADTTQDLLLQQFAMNTVSCLLSCRAAIANMRAGGAGGRLINVAARVALRPEMGAKMVAYTIAKSGVAALTQALAEEVREESITVVAVCPSVIDTPVNRRDMPDADHRRWVAPADLATIVVRLCADETGVVSGALIPVYGLA